MSFGTATIRTLTVGSGTTYPWIVLPTVRRLVAPETLTSKRGDRHGMVGGRQTLPSLLIPMAFTHAAVDQATALADCDDVLAAFAPVDADIELELLDRTYFGRPGPVDPDFARFVGENRIDYVATFDALDPIAYGDEDTDTGTSLTINNAGNTRTDRITIVVTGNGGTPIITNATDDNRAIRFGTTLAGAATRTIDVRARTIVTGSTDKYGELATTNEWWDLLPGDNSITVTGAASIDITWRPAWF